MTKSSCTPLPGLPLKLEPLTGKLEGKGHVLINCEGLPIAGLYGGENEAIRFGTLIVHRVSNWDKLVEALERIEALTLVTNTKSETLLDQLAAIRLSTLAAQGLAKEVE